MAAAAGAARVAVLAVGCGVSERLAWTLLLLLVLIVWTWVLWALGVRAW
jgi:hypothetical protein